MAISIASCGQSRPRSLEDARRTAINDFVYFLNESNIDFKYFNGPVLIDENEKSFTFVWACNIPWPETGYYIEYVSKEPIGTSSFRTEGRFPPIDGTLFFPLNEAALYSLFELPPDSRDRSERAKRLRMIPLTLEQLEDVSNLTYIRVDISDYARCFNCAFPDSLSWLKNIKVSDYHNDCEVRELDSLRSHDRYGNEYYYENFIRFVVLGTPGANGKWDFNNAIMDSIYNDFIDHIYLNGDDIIVKLLPISLGCY